MYSLHVNGKTFSLFKNTTTFTAEAHILRAKDHIILIFSLKGRRGRGWRNAITRKQFFSCLTNVTCCTQPEQTFCYHQSKTGFQAFTIYQVCKCAAYITVKRMEALLGTNIGRFLTPTASRTWLTTHTQRNGSQIFRLYQEAIK